MDSTIEISVIIPVQNRENTIIQCVNSIISQTYLPKEIIIVDDGSSDNTVTILKSLNNELIRVITNKHSKGAQGARNEGIKAAKCDWIAFLDSDDEWLPDKLEKQASLIQKNELNDFSVIQCGCYKYFKKNNTKELWNIPICEGNSSKVLSQLILEPGPMFQGLLTSKTALETIGYLDEKTPSYQEWDTSIMLAKNCDYYWVDEPLFTYHIGNKETTFQNKGIRIQGIEYILDKNKELIVSIHGLKEFSNQVYQLIMLPLNGGLWDKAKKIIKMKERYLSRSQLTRLLLFLFLKIKPQKITFLTYFLQNPFYGLKHLLKKLLRIKTSRK
ncbi:MAG: glycosyltransferase family 2 protein [Flavobacteriales bacterium]|nr:glycosyltransferase family 2 protein [Flavobacteriales bacterium]